ITSHQLREGALLSPEECSYDGRVIHRLQTLPDGSFDRDNLLTDDVSHSSLLYIRDSHDIGFVHIHWNFLHLHVMHGVCRMAARSKLLSIKRLWRLAQA